ncbi:DUF3000 family protein [Bifidobacterium boum]|uniref:DUF3000 family protein n=1 Tax=Bifidobacterium boum TaxID=78343 RepID=UPI003F914022
MAQIFSFPGRASARREHPPARPDGVPDTVWHAVQSVFAMPTVPGVQFHEVPVPKSIADYGIGVGMVRADDATQSDDWSALWHVSSCAHPGGIQGGNAIGSGDMHKIVGEAAWGWIMLLYYADPPQEWESRWRCVAFCRIPGQPDTHDDDGHYTAACWHAVNSGLHKTGVDTDTISGTITVSHDTFFGRQANDNMPARCELRVSWTPPARDLDTPDSIDAGMQVAQWAELVAHGIG